MDKYIKQLLELYSKIILPQFGAIVIENEETGELMFNEYLSYDDGKLSALIEKESNMDLQVAQNMVAKFVRELQAQLDKGETYSIFNLGEFKKNEDGEVIFTGNLKTNLSSTSAPNEEEPKKTTAPVASLEKEKEKVSEKKENDSDVKNNDKVKKNTYVEKSATPPESSSRKNEDAKPNKEAKKEKPKKVKKEKVKKEKVKTPPKAKNPKKPKAPKKPGDKNKKRKMSPVLWIILILLLLVAAGSTYVGLNYEKVEKFMGWDKFDNVEQANVNTEKENVSTENEVPEEEEDKTEVEESDAIVEDDEVINETVVPDEVEEEKLDQEAKLAPTPQTSKGNHHIIVGCFSELSNAQNLVSIFKQQGFDSKIIGQYGGLHFVSAQSYPSSSEAYKNLSRVRQIKDGAWLFTN